ncbi:FAD-linked oxidoreductase patO [Pseudocercospora fuligena]|uniref:FAD-linked oxidoreductase patO n=1 Tax=Pseudocercospora fuligena TaxID=685502 RepID=A0A8H6RKQ3_9PEZI|nr:FAD-linked oxidoreductase patO [Pseudocercospora fuligena]
MGWELVTSLRSLGRLALAILPQQIRLGLSVPGSETCRCFPGDTCWPTSQEWASFNQSVKDNLVATVPLGAPCHDSSFGPYNATECSRLREQWTFPELHYVSSSSAMAPYFANASCDPFTERDARCEHGTYVRYAVDVHSAEEVSATLEFAKSKNIRIVIRNTGHDWNGKSTGAGALAIWTHNLKDIKVFDYQDEHYSGKAMRMGAGVQAFEAYAAAHEHDVVVLGGECPTVGLAGGYTTGGGHSALSSKYGLSADQVLAWEVVDGSGRHLIATRDNDHRDLYWAISGGGGGTYAVVLSMTVKVHPDTMTSGAKLRFSSNGIRKDIYWQAIEAYHVALPDIVDEGIVSVAQFDHDSFAINPMTGPGVSSERMKTLLQTYLKSLDDLGVNYTLEVKQFPNYFEEFQAMFSHIGTASFQYGSRIISRNSMLENLTAITTAFRQAADDSCSFFSVASNVSETVAGDVYNAVNPVWRTALLHAVIQAPWDSLASWSTMVASAEKMTSKHVAAFEAVTPGSGVYINEADPNDPRWKESYYGMNYERLLQVKDNYDPDGIFYALTAVGADRWEEKVDGRLCKTAKGFDGRWDL